MQDTISAETQARVHTRPILLFASQSCHNLHKMCSIQIHTSNQLIHNLLTPLLEDNIQWVMKMPINALSYPSHKAAIVIKIMKSF